jgi:amino acid adenylation domain-containing protein
MPQTLRHARPSDVTFVDILREAAGLSGEQPAFTFLLDGEAQASVLTYAELDRRARSLASWLQCRLRAGERGLIVCDPGLDHIVAFFACLYAGVIAVPAPPPGRRTENRIRAIAQASSPAAVLCNSGKRAAASRLIQESGLAASAACVDVGEAGSFHASEWRSPRIDPLAPALLQFTSGSTSSPKGVVIAHANLVHNQEQMRRAFGTHAESSVAGWLPLHHDMGLIGTVLHTVFMRISCVLMSPVHFIEKPIRWLLAISEYRATVSGGPDFAFDHCVRRTSPEDRETLDLSSWEVAFSGAEPVRPATLRSFARAFEPAGFRPEAFYPCYGLAEATLFVAGRPSGQAHAAASFDRASLEAGMARMEPAGGPGRELIGYDTGSAGELLIVDPERRTVRAENQLGEIWVAGPSIGKGYWNCVEETEMTFRSRLAGSDSGPFLRTGDLGFLHEGALFIAGRLKDLIIIRGRNLHPQDIEETAERSHEGLGPSAAAAFSIEDGEQERLVLVHEIARHCREEEHDEISVAIRRAVAKDHDVNIHTVVLVRTGTIPRTSSGKVQRGRCRSQFLDGTLAELARSTLAEAEGSDIARAEGAAALAGSPTERRDRIGSVLREEIGRLTGDQASKIDGRLSLNALGIDSLGFVELVHRLEPRLGVPLPVERVMAAESIGVLAEMVAAEQASPLSRSVPIDETRFALSRGQRALWFQEQLEGGGGAASRLACAVNIHGRLDAGAFQGAVRALIARHPALRTTIAAPGDEPLQEVQERSGEAVAFEDVSGWSGNALCRRVQEIADSPMDIQRGPLARAHLLYRSENDHVFVLAMHHAIADFWSACVMLRDLEELYMSAKEHSTPRLAPLEASYRDYVEWEREMTTGPNGERLWSFWQAQLRGAPPVLELPTDHPRPAVRTFRGGACACIIDGQITERMKQLAKARGTTLFTVLLACYQVLLHRYSGQAEFVVGTPVANRPRARWRDLVGNFVNIVPLRADLSTNPTFEDLLAQTHATTRAMLAHQAFPFSALVERVRPERDPGRPPLVQCTLTFLSESVLGSRGLALLASGASDAGFRMADLTFAAFPIERRASQFDLTLALADGGHGISGSFEYNADLFEPETIQEMSGHWRVLLGAIAERPATRVRTLPLLTAAKRRETLHRWNNTASVVQGAAVHRVFEEQLQNFKDCAVADEASVLSFGELNARANRLARYLGKLGVTRESRVAVCMRRSVNTLVALLAVLKAGGAYVPLDPGHPRRRLSQVLTDSAAPVLLTDQNTLPSLPVNGANVVPIDGQWAGIPGQDVGNLPGRTGRLQAAYVIYTSGSTGTPNGVVVSHGAFVNLLESMRREPGVKPGSRMLSVTTPTFDIAGLELFLPLLSGADLMIAGAETVGDSRKLVRLISEWNATSMQATPATWRMLLEAGWPGKADLTILCGGESLPADLAKNLAPRCKALWNMYGPTETTIWSMTGLVQRDDTRIGLGRPIANTEIYVLDPELEPVPAGVAGELHIAGEGLARGYLGRPHLTAARFLPNPFNDRPGSRMYKTGDLARFTRHGSLEFLGRADHQIKLRGFRIEPREIESVLAEHVQVRQAVVIPRTDPRGDLSLTAYVVLRDGLIDIESIDQDLRRHLAASLPAHMIPQAIVPLPDLPLTPNRKLDRGALPAPPATRAARPSSQPPATRVEETIAAIWRDLLNLDGIAMEQNFFDLGGHSLLLNQVRTRIFEALRIEVPVLEFFRHPTIRSMARYIAAASEPCAKGTSAFDSSRDDAGPRLAAGARRSEARRMRRKAQAASGEEWRHR